MAPTDRDRQRRDDRPTPRPRKRTSGRRTSVDPDATVRFDPVASQRGARKAPVRPSRPGTARRGPGEQSGAPGGRCVARRLAIVLGLTALGLAIGLGVLYATVLAGLPDPNSRPKGRDQTTRVLDRNGKVIASLFAEQDRTDVPLDQIPVELRQGVVATEDQRFYEHRGVDPIGILRALWTDIRAGDTVQGGSTITQQYVKNAFVTPERTLRRKLMEAALAERVERKLTKDQILESYLNTIYYGHGAYGVESAAQTYFGKSVSKLDLAQSAMIAGVIKSPGRYSPYIDPEAAKVRRDVVLDQMLSEGYIDREAHDAAVAAPVKTAGLKERPSVAPYFVEYVKALLTEEYGSEAVYRGGLTVRTSLDLGQQAAAERAVKKRLGRKGDPSAALVAIDPKTGEIRAMVGGRDFKSQQFNVAVQGRRQPGSAFKPFVLVTALEEGISPEQTFESGPVTLKVSGSSDPWKVTGAGGGRRGPMRLREATEKSVNSVYAQLILKVGAKEVVGMSEKLGITDPIAPVPAIALGGHEEGVSPLQMASSYGTLANGGVRVKPRAILEVKDRQGEILSETEPVSERAVSAAVAYLTTDILRGVISKGTGKAASIGRPAAGKTGTTQRYRDAWFAGYTPDLAAAVWVGYADAQREMTSVHGRKVTGGSFPAQIWSDFMKAALADSPERDFDKPDGLASAKICLDTGLKARDYCPNTGSGLFLAGKVPELCTVHTQPTKITIPKLVGMTKEAALALLKELMLLAKVVEKDVEGVQAGIVADQSPAAGSSGTTQTVVTIVVSNGGSGDLPPVAEFSFSVGPTAGGKAKVDFDATASTDDGAVASYVWEFADGSPQGEGAKVSHSYAPGSYDVTLWVTDDKGQVASVTHSVRVR